MLLKPTLLSIDPDEPKYTDMEPDKTSTEKELEKILEELGRRIEAAQELFGTEGNELRTGKAALKGIEQELEAARKEKKEQKL